MNKKIYLSPERRPAPHGKYWGMTIYEHDVCREIAALVAPMLEAHGFEVRTGAPEKDMAARVKEAAAWGANYYMPIHTNASTNGEREGNAQGPLVLAYNHPMSRDACQMVYDCLMEVYPGKGQGVRVEKTFYEINQTPMLSVYPELAYHDNGEDARWIVSSKDKIAVALCKGICRWFGVEWQEPVEPPPPADADPDGSYQAEIDYLAELLDDTRQELATERTTRAVAEDELTRIKAEIWALANNNRP